MKFLIVSLLMAFNLNAFSAVKLERGLYVPVDGSGCAYELERQTRDGVVIIFRNNPTTIANASCAVGIDYPIAAEVVDSKTFIDLRTNRVFKLYKTPKLKLGLYVPVDGDSCAYQVVKQTNDGVVIIFRYNPTVTPSRKCAVGVDYPIAAKVLDRQTLVDLRTDRVFRFHSEF